MCFLYEYAKLAKELTKDSQDIFWVSNPGLSVCNGN